MSSVGIFIQVGPHTWRFVRDETPPARSALPMPMIISDEMPPTEQVDGVFYTSKSKFRAVGRSLGLIEVGNEKFKPRVRSQITPLQRRKRRDTLARAAAEYKEGRRYHGN